MKKAEFEASPSGRLVPTERNQWAFVPNPLPPAEIDLAVLAEPIAQAAQALGELNGIGRTLPDPYLLIRPLQVQEALTSSSMEGTYTTLSDLLLVEAGAGEQNRAPDTREVLNYRRALSAAIESLDDCPLSLRTLCDAHRTLLGEWLGNAAQMFAPESSSNIRTSLAPTKSKTPASCRRPASRPSPA
ncbi:MAG: hypothetical protein MZV49_12480 [Rhodopseudomonas palustris]|nr:hypothetical protein [Rhodopseudomonas palustris]